MRAQGHIFMAFYFGVTILKNGRCSWGELKRVETCQNDKIRAKLVNKLIEIPMKELCFLPLKYVNVSKRWTNHHH